MKVSTILVFCSVVTIFIGCSNTALVQLTPDIYMLTKVDCAGKIGNMPMLKADVINEANAFAESKGKVAVPIHAKQQPPGYLGQWSSYEYQFRVVDKNYPEVQKASFATAPDITIKKTDNFDVDIESKDFTSKDRDIFSEIIKLNDLRQKGILTEDEFRTQKEKLLSCPDLYLN